MQIAAIVIASWINTIYGQFELLAGKSAPHEFLQLLVYNAMTFSDDIDKVDTVRAYHVRHWTSCCLALRFADIVYRVDP